MFPLMKRQSGLWCPLCEVIVAEKDALSAPESLKSGHNQIKG